MKSKIQSIIKYVVLFYVCYSNCETLCSAVNSDEANHILFWTNLHCTPASQKTPNDSL